MSTTTKLGLIKPSSTDFINIEDINGNMDIIDQTFENKANKEDIPTSLPAAGGNADTVDNKHASDFANASHNHTASQITGLPTSLPANGGNSDTVDGWHVNLAIGNWGIKPICAGTGDMVAGATGLSQGHVYIVYE